jgi:hypothetical protein
MDPLWLSDNLAARSTRTVKREQGRTHSVDKIVGPVVDQVIDTGGPLSKSRSAAWQPHSAWEQLIVRAHNLESVYHRICTLR